MDKEQALDYLRVFVMKLYTNPDLYEDGDCNVLWALEDVVIPMLEKEIKQHENV